MTGILIAAAVIGIPFAVFVLWPLVSRRGAPVLLPLPPDPREPLVERKMAALRTLRELDFEHETGHVSDDDYVELRARYEAETAAVLTELDRLGGEIEPARPRRAPRPVATTSAWRHPLALGAGAVALVVFGIALGAGLVRYTEPDRTGDAPMPSEALLPSTSELLCETVAPFPIAVALVSVPGFAFAPSPTSVSPVPVVTLPPAPAPTMTLLPPVVSCRALYAPITVFCPPDVSASAARAPTAVFNAENVVARSALPPMATLWPAVAAAASA